MYKSPKQWAASLASGQTGYLRYLLIVTIIIVKLVSFFFVFNVSTATFLLNNPLLLLLLYIWWSDHLCSGPVYYISYNCYFAIGLNLLFCCSKVFRIIRFDIILHRYTYLLIVKSRIKYALTLSDIVGNLYILFSEVITVITYQMCTFKTAR